MEHHPAADLGFDIQENLIILFKAIILKGLSLITKSNHNYRRYKGMIFSLRTT
jgi:hypothetical protein